jgi:hypothetical protein
VSARGGTALSSLDGDNTIKLSFWAAASAQRALAAAVRALPSPLHIKKALASKWYKLVSPAPSRALKRFLRRCRGRGTFSLYFYLEAPPNLFSGGGIIHYFGFPRKAPFIQRNFQLYFPILVRVKVGGAGFLPSLKEPNDDLRVGFEALDVDVVGFAAPDDERVCPGESLLIDGDECLFPAHYDGGRRGRFIIADDFIGVVSLA